MAHHGVRQEDIEGLLDHLDQRARHGDQHVLAAMEDPVHLENMILQQYAGIPPMLARIGARQFHAMVMQMREEAEREERRRRIVEKGKSRGDAARGGMDAEEFFMRRVRPREDGDEEEDEDRERDRGRKSGRKLPADVASTARRDRRKKIAGAVTAIRILTTKMEVPLSVAYNIVKQMYGDDILVEAQRRMGELTRT